MKIVEKILKKNEKMTGNFKEQRKKKCKKIKKTNKIK